ncbi:MAG: MATE family efflux transporter, partial [Bacteroidetes bacterium 4572_114]
RPLAISNIVRSLYMLLMIHIWSFSTSVNTLISNIIGEGKPQLVFPIISRVNKFSLMITILVMIVSVVFSGYLIRIYTDDPALIAGARPVLFVVTGVLLPLSISNNWFNGVSGTGNTKIALFIEIGSIVLYVAYIFILTFALKASLPAIWTSEYVYIVTIGIFSYLYLKFGKWEGKKV